ncbi:MAG: hypothetical protein Q4C70_07140 [Planctomycetia bacterium]|nr:hypothetical protein [Planctomycetia bacterium]
MVISSEEDVYVIVLLSVVVRTMMRSEAVVVEAVAMADLRDESERSVFSISIMLSDSEVSGRENSAYCSRMEAYSAGVTLSSRRSSRHSSRRMEDLTGFLRVRLVQERRTEGRNRNLPVFS